MYPIPDENYNKLNPKCKRSMYITYSTMYIILFVIVFAIVFAFGYFDEIGIYQIITVAILVVILACVIAVPQIFYRYYRYTITPEKIDVFRGVIIIRRTVVPIERIHQVEVTSGPVNNMLGLADVNITTAGGVAKIQFLEIPVANEIAEKLNALINKAVRDRKEDE